MKPNFTELQLLEARVHNLEFTLHTFWSILQDLQPPAYQEQISQLFRDSYKASKNLGAFKDQMLQKEILAMKGKQWVVGFDENFIHSFIVYMRANYSDTAKVFN